MKVLTTTIPLLGVLFTVAFNIWELSEVLV